MKRIKIIGALLIIFSIKATAQVRSADSVIGGIVVTEKDPRLDILAKKEYEFNSGKALGPRAEKGYRLQVLNSNDQAYAMKVRSQLLQKYPEQKVYMSFQAPYIKLKFGNFTDKKEAEKFRDRILKDKVVTNVYLVAEVVEVKGDKKDKDEDQ